MSALQFSRAHLEALLVASIVVRPDVEAILERVDPTCLSPSARALIAQLTSGDDEPVRTATKGQAALADRVEAITVRELLDHSLDTLVGLINGLPPRAIPERAWERDLAAGIESGAAA